MGTFANAVRNQNARTTNGMKARADTANACVDLFFNIGAMRGKNVIPSFVAAYAQNPELAVRIALWARDARGGAGERKIFRDILEHLSFHEPQLAERVLKKVPELGRWDDIFAAQGDVRRVGFEMVRSALAQSNGLAAKWMPRKGVEAAELRNYLGMTPKQYRKTLVALTKVVEQNMCSGNWDEINFNHVPSVASARYKKAFARRTPQYAAWVEKLVKGDKTAKVNAGAVYPYDVLKGLINLSGYNTARYNNANLGHIQAQWDALPNFVGDADILPLVDVSGSMTCKAGGWQSKSEVTCLDVAVSLGLYLADKNTGKFKDTFLTFSTDPQLLHLQGDILQKIQQMITSKWSMSTDLFKAVRLILQVARENNVPQSEMPKAILILSDMQFNARYDQTAYQMIVSEYAKFGYTFPQIVYWNLNSQDNVPVKFDQQGTALVSGFSPSIVKAVVSGDMEQFTPEGIMYKAVLADRYDF